MWVDDEYLARKETRTVIHDKREIIPKCVVLVSDKILQVCTCTVSLVYRRLGGGTPATMAYTVTTGKALISYRIVCLLC